MRVGEVFETIKISLAPFNIKANIEVVKVLIDKKNTKKAFTTNILEKEIREKIYTYIRKNKTLTKINKLERLIKEKKTKSMDSSLSILTHEIKTLELQKDKLKAQLIIKILKKLAVEIRKNHNLKVKIFPLKLSVVVYF